MDHSTWTVEDYKNAIQALKRKGKWTDTRARMLCVQYQAPGHTLIEPELTFLMGWSGHAGNMNYGKLGKLIGAELSGLSPEMIDEGYNVLSLDDGWRESDDVRWPGLRFFWAMRPALAQALEALGLVGEAGDEPRMIASVSVADGDLPPGNYPEGATRQIIVNAYERNWAARQACVDYHGTICSVCDSDLEEFYGPIASGFIHVHHLKPLSEISAGYSVNPQTDLVPVCPNCHAMLHRTTPPLTVEQLRDLIQAAH